MTAASLESEGPFYRFALQEFVAGQVTGRTQRAAVWLIRKALRSLMS